MNLTAVTPLEVTTLAPLWRRRRSDGRMGRRISSARCWSCWARQARLRHASFTTWLLQNHGFQQPRQRLLRLTLGLGRTIPGVVVSGGVRMESPVDCNRKIFLKHHRSHLSLNWTIVLLTLLNYVTLPFTSPIPSRNKRRLKPGTPMLQTWPRSAKDWDPGEKHHDGLWRWWWWWGFCGKYCKGRLWWNCTTAKLPIITHIIKQIISWSYHPVFSWSHNILDNLWSKDDDDDDDDDVGDDDDDVGDDCDVDLNPLSPISAGETDQHGGQLRIDRPKQLAWISPWWWWWWWWWSSSLRDDITSKNAKTENFWPEADCCHWRAALKFQMVRNIALGVLV